MQWSDIPFDPSRKTLRQFAGLWLVFFGGMALWQALGAGVPRWGSPSARWPWSSAWRA